MAKKIENAVKTDNFPTTFHKAMVNLYYSYKWFENHLDEVFEKYNLLSQHFNVLKIVNGKKEPCSVKDIREVIMDKGRDLTRLIDKLESRGYLLRELNPDNRRQMLISITNEGSRIVSKMDRELLDKIESINKISEEEAQILSNILNKVRSA